MKRRELVELWATALESGQYPQTRSHLRDSMGYCCLGVVCDVLLKHNAVSNASWGEPGREGVVPVVVHDSNFDTYLPENIASMLGLDYNGGLLANDNKSRHYRSWPVIADHILANANDRGVSFADIAKALRQALAAGLIDGDAEVVDPWGHLVAGGAK